MKEVNTIATSTMALLILAAATPLSAATLYTDRAAWESTTTGFSNIDFESYAEGHLGSAFTDDGVTFDAKDSFGDDGYLFRHGPSTGYDTGSGNWVYGGFGVEGSYQRWMEVTTPGGYNSLGMDVSTYGTTGFVSATVVTNLGSFEQVVATTYGGLSFIGFNLVDGETLSYMRVENVASLAGFNNTGTGGGIGGENYLFDNVSYGSVSAVPVPAAIWLFGSGLIGLIGVARRKKA